MTTDAARARWAVAHAISDRLETLGAARLSVHRGEVPGTPPAQPGGGGRIAPYAVVWGAAGQPDYNASLSATPGQPALMSGQVTFVAGYLDDLLAVLDEAVPLLQLWTPTIPGLSCGRLRQAPGFDPGTPRRLDSTRPPRFETPWLWQLHVATSST